MTAFLPANRPPRTRTTLPDFMNFPMAVNKWKKGNSWMTSIKIQTIPMRAGGIYWSAFKLSQVTCILITITVNRDVQAQQHLPGTGYCMFLSSCTTYLWCNTNCLCSCLNQSENMPHLVCKAITPRKFVSLSSVQPCIHLYLLKVVYNVRRKLTSSPEMP